MVQLFVLTDSPHNFPRNHHTLTVPGKAIRKNPANHYTLGFLDVYMPRYLKQTVNHPYYVTDISLDQAVENSLATRSGLAIVEVSFCNMTEPRHTTHMRVVEYEAIPQLVVSKEYLQSVPIHIVETYI